jgi:hypothetical protein
MAAVPARWRPHDGERLDERSNSYQRTVRDLLDIKREEFVRLRNSSEGSNEMGDARAPARPRS